MCIIYNYFLLAISLTYLFACLSKILGYRAGSNTSQKLSQPILLHLLLQGDIFRVRARLTQNLICLVKNLLITDNIKALVVYGSPYINKLSTLTLL